MSDWSCYVTRMVSSWRVPPIASFEMEASLDPLVVYWPDKKGESIKCVLWCVLRGMKFFLKRVAISPCHDRSRNVDSKSNCQSVCQRLVDIHGLRVKAKGKNKGRFEVMNALRPDNGFSLFYYGQNLTEVEISGFSMGQWWWWCDNVCNGKP